MLHVAIAIAFITIAIPLKLDREWITMAGSIESAVLLFVSVKTRTNFLRYLRRWRSSGIVRLPLFDGTTRKRSSSMRALRPTS